MADEELPAERLRLTALLSGRREPEGWAQDAAPADFYDIKGVVEELLARLAITEVRWPAGHGEGYYHPGKSCAVETGKLRAWGPLANFTPQCCAASTSPQPVYLLDLDAEALFAAAGSHPGFRPLSRYPDSERDSALLVDEEVTAQQLFDALRQVRLKDLGKSRAVRCLPRGIVAAGEEEPGDQGALPGFGPYSDRRNRAGTAQQNWSRRCKSPSAPSCAEKSCCPGVPGYAIKTRKFR